MNHIKTKRLLLLISLLLFVCTTSCCTKKSVDGQLDEFRQEDTHDKIIRAMAGAQTGAQQETLITDVAHGACISGYEAWESFVKSVSSGRPAHVNIVIADKGDEIQKTLSFDGRKYHLYQNSFYDVTMGRWVKKAVRVNGKYFLYIPEFEGYIANSYYISNSDDVARNELEDHYDWLRERYVKGKAHKILTVQESSLLDVYSPDVYSR